MLSDSDYYLLAERNVKRGQRTVNLPNVPTDKTFLDEEEAHVKHQQHEEQQRCHDYYGPGWMPNLFPIGNVSFFRTEEGEGPPSYTIPEPGAYFAVPWNLSFTIFWLFFYYFVLPVVIQTKRFIFRENRIQHSDSIGAPRRGRVTSSFTTSSFTTR